MDSDLREQRMMLVEEIGCYDRDAYPGTKDWYPMVEAENALRAFDKQHPEILAANRAARSAKIKRDNPTMWDN